MKDMIYLISNPYNHPDDIILPSDIDLNDLSCIFYAEGRNMYKRIIFKISEEDYTILTLSGKFYEKYITKNTSTFQMLCTPDEKKMITSKHEANVSFL